MTSNGVSIIVPVYNAEVFIGKTIESVLEQTFSDWELLLVEDCGQDDSVGVIEQYIKENYGKEIRLIRQDTNQGAAAARNRGVDEARGRYISFLDADDLWYPDKLENELLFMEKHNAGFVFSSYMFGDENAVPTGKMVRVPKRLTYKEALSRTVIFTSTVLFDTQKIDKDLLHMPEIGSEDTATWWRILKAGHTAYGLDQPLVIYRRPATSLSSNKKTAVKRIWNLYKTEAKLSTFAAVLAMIGWAYRATVRRVVDDTIRAHFGAIKRFAVLQLSVLGMLFYTAIFGWMWFERFYPLLNTTRYNQLGKSLGIGIKLYFRGHILMLAIYLVLLIFMSRSTGGMKTGYLKPGGVFSSEIVALLVTNTITYFQLSLLRNWLLPVKPFVVLFGIQIAAAGIWAFLSYYFYMKVFPARETLVVDLSESEDENTSTVHFLLDRFATRPDRFNVMKTMRNAPLKRIKGECLKWYGCVVLIGGTAEERRELVEFCYRNYIRIYVLPEIIDLLYQGMEYMNLFDAPLLELKEYSIRWEARIVKRSFDILAGAAGIIILLPIMLIQKIRGQRIAHDTVIGKGGKEFVRYFYAHGFCRWPMMINLLKGDVSLVGPMPLTKEQTDLIEEKEIWASYQNRLKPGIVGYSQLVSSRQTSLSDQLKMDIYYTLHFSLLSDFKLILQSFGQHRFGR